MNTKLLKQKILDLAIRGKLTDQRKSDRTTADLLKEISSASHSERIAKGAKSKDSGTIIPLDKDDAPFEIPENWEWVKLGDLGIWQAGCTPSKSNPAFYKNGDIPWVNTGDLNNGLIIDIPKCVTKEALEKTSLRLNETGSVCIAMYGATIGKIGILSRPATTNQACCVCNKLKKDVIEKLYLFYFLMAHKQQFIEAGFGGAQPNISKEKIVATAIPLPPLAEQQRIVAKIEEAFAEIDEIEKNKENLKTHIAQTRQKILDLAIHGKLVEQNPDDEPASVLLERILSESNSVKNTKGAKKKATSDNRPYEKLTDVPFEIPTTWEWVRLGDLALDMADGPFGSNLKTEHYTSEKEARLIQLSNIGERGWRDENTKYTTFEHAIRNISRSIVEPGNIVIAKMMPAGRAIICPAIEKMYVLSSDAVKMAPTPFVNVPLLLYFINSPFFRGRVTDKVQGTTRLRTSISKLKASLLPLPPLAEQKRIVEQIENIFKSLDEISLNLV